MQNEPSHLKAFGFPWRSLAALVLALTAQLMLEPPAKIWVGIVLYIAAIGLVVWSFLRGEWVIAWIAEDIYHGDTEALGFKRFFSVALWLRGSKQILFFLSLPLLGAAFYFFRGNQFTVLNISLWLTGLVLFIVAFWSTTARTADFSRLGVNRLKSAVQKMDWEWLVLLLAVFVFAAFFRFYRLNEVLAEPFSDHAEKLLDVYDISKGNTSIFFIRNTGREGLQMYWTFLVAKIFGTGISFFSLKLGTALIGLFTLPFVYLLGKEFGNPVVGFFAMFLFGISYWMNVTARIGLRFPLYPLFAAGTLLFLTRGLRTASRNDFLLCGLLLGLGLHGYTPFRIMPFVVLTAFAIFILHNNSKAIRVQAVQGLTIIAVTALMVFLPLLRYWLEYPEVFGLRAFSRLDSAGTFGSLMGVFFSNLANALLMFNVDDGNIWVNSLPHRPALDVVTGAFFVIGLVLLGLRYLRQRDWRDLFLLVLIPLLLMPSVLSLAYPEENPALNRAGGAAVAATLIAALAVEGLVVGTVRGVESGQGPEKRRGFILHILVGVLLAAASFQNYDLVLRQFDRYFRIGAWNSSEMGRSIKFFGDVYGRTDTAWIVPYEQWVDTRLPALWMGDPNRDFALWPSQFADTLAMPAPKMFIFNLRDLDTKNALKQLYPNGTLSRYTSATTGKDYMIFFVEE
ncbi:MAG TPA: glycosyltransferase family 39 protein [Anaerolineales bacterium]|nr:glycosyltransferase family 39 protein [Anaerolineales bacterium]